MKTHETDLSTQQTPPQENDRLPRPYENGRRAQGDQPPPPPRAQKTRRLTFPKSIRLRSRRDFLRVGREKRREVGRFFCVDFRPAAQAKLGISASSRYGSAPERNRFKRLIREAFRTSYSWLPPLELNVIPRQCAKKASCADIRDELIRLLAR